MNKLLFKSFCLLFAMLVFIPISAQAQAATNNYYCVDKKTIKVGEKVTLALPDEVLAVAPTGYMMTCNWTLSSDAFDYIEKTADNIYSCTIRGKRETYNDVKVSFKGTSVLHDAMWQYEGYYLITVSNTVLVKKIELNYWSHGLTVGKTLQLTATVLPENAADKSVTWYSEDPDVASVDQNGLVTALKTNDYGGTHIHCQANDRTKTDVKCSIFVFAAPIPVNEITIDETSLLLFEGEKKKFTATVKPDNATDKKLIWESSNENVAKFDSWGWGELTAKGEGTATITCRANDGSGVKATCEVTVKPKIKGEFTAKTIEGAELTFYGSSYDRTCYVCSHALDVNYTGKITIPEEVNHLKVTRIAGYAFENCKGITQVIVPSSVTNIEQYVFSECTSLTSASLGDGVKKLSHGTFYNCSSLTYITGLNQVEEAENNTFKGTPWFDNLPDGLLYIGKMLYQYKGTMPDNTTIDVEPWTKSISNGAFTNCTGLVGINISESVETIGRSSNFEGCTNLTSITVASGNKKFDSRNNCNAIIETATNTLVAGCNSTIIPSSVTSIDRYVFHDSGIKSITIPDNVETIGYYSLYDCKSLTNVTIGKGLKKIGESSFHFCPKLKVSVSPSNPYYDSRDNCNCLIETATNKLIAGSMPNKIPSSVKIIGEYAFSGDASTIEIPDGVEKIEKSAFMIYDLSTLVLGKDVIEIADGAFGSSKLTVIQSKNANPTNISEKAFDDKVYTNATLYVPVGSKTKYQNATGWKNFKNIVEFDPSTFDPSTLNIHGVTMDADKDTPVFDLFGRKLAQPKKGINIINGRKVIVK